MTMVYWSITFKYWNWRNNTSHYFPLYRSKNSSNNEAYNFELSICEINKNETTETKYYEYKFNFIVYGS